MGRRKQDLAPFASSSIAGSSLVIPPLLVKIDPSLAPLADQALSQVASGRYCFYDYFSYNYLFLWLSILERKNSSIF
jgi:hypothetical protein